MNEKFDAWNEVKKNTNKIDFILSIKPREIYFSKLGYNIGSEQYGKGKDFVRPLIIIRQLTKDLFIGVPTTTSKKTNNDYFHTISYRDNLNRNIISSAMILQQRVFSKKRLLNKIGKIDNKSFQEIQQKLKKLIDPIN